MTKLCEQAVCERVARETVVCDQVVCVCVKVVCDKEEARTGRQAGEGEDGSAQQENKNPAQRCVERNQTMV